MLSSFIQLVLHSCTFTTRRIPYVTTCVANDLWHMGPHFWVDPCSHRLTDIDQIRHGTVTAWWPKRRRGNFLWSPRATYAPDRGTGSRKQFFALTSWEEDGLTVQCVVVRIVTQQYVSSSMVSAGPAFIHILYGGLTDVERSMKDPRRNALFCWRDALVYHCRHRSSTSTLNHRSRPQSGWSEKRKSLHA